MMDASPRKDFIRKFSKLSCRDDDEITELTSRLDAVPGITSRSAGSDLYFCFVADNIAHAFVTFTIKDETAKIYVEPNRTKKFMEEHGLFPFESEGYYEGIRNFLPASHKQHSYPYGNRFYADIDKVLYDMDAFIEITQDFMDEIFYHD